MKRLLLSIVVTVGAASLEGGQFTLYNIVPYSPGREDEAASRAVDLCSRTGIDLALYSLSLHPTGKPARTKAEECLGSYRRFRHALQGTSVRAGVLVQSILGHWPRVDKDIEDWTRTIDITGRAVRFCPLDPGFSQYISNVFAAIAKEHPAFVMVDDDVRAFSHNAECFCPRHVRMFNEKCKTAYSEEALRDRMQNVSASDPDYKAFLAIQREMIEENVVGRARMAIDAVDPDIPGGVCVAAEEHFLCAPIARRFAARGQKPILRISGGCYNERAWGAKLPFRICRSLAFAEYYRESGIALLAEADTCPHNLWSKSAQSFFSLLATSAFSGLDGAKIWYVNGRKNGALRPVSQNYTKVLERHRGYLDVLASEVAQVRPLGVAIPCFTNFPGWHLAGDTRQFFIEERNAGTDVFVPFGIPFYVSKDFGHGLLSLLSAAEVDRLTDIELERIFSGAVLVFREAALALARRGRDDLMGAEVSEERLVFNAERDEVTGEMMPRSPTGGKDVKLSVSGKGEVLATLRFCENGSSEAVSSSAVLCRNALGGRVVTVTYSPTLPYYQSVLSEARKRWIVSLLDRLAGRPFDYVVGQDQDVLVWAREKTDGTVLVLAENMNPEPIDRLSFRVNGSDFRYEVLSDTGVWLPVTDHQQGESIVELPVQVPYFASVVVRTIPKERKDKK